MAIRPRVHRIQVERAISSIAGRRDKVDDPNRWRLPDAPDSDPREVLAYLRVYSGADIPRWVLQADIGDALTLNSWLWWEDQRTELHFLQAGRRRGLFLSQLGAQLGVGKQGIINRIDRLEALLRYDRPDEKITRAARKSRQEALARRPAEMAWLQDRFPELIELMAGCVSEADRYGLDDEQREWIDQLAQDVRDGDITPATMVIWGLALSELRAAPVVLALDSSRPHHVHTVISRSEAIRAEFAAIGRAAPKQ